MRRIFITVSYDGTQYAGWQRQPNVATIQGLIEDNLRIITGEEIDLHGSGRTDSGVHALGQVAHFDTGVRMPADKFCNALNVGLPDDIRVLESHEVDWDLHLHARFSAKRKFYRYAIHNAAVASALCGRYRWHLHTPLDVEAMQEAAPSVLGEHDFAAFAASGGKIKKTVRRIFCSEIRTEGDMIYYDIEGNGFLYNMVRILVGTLVDIGYHRLPVDYLGSLLQKKERMFAGQTAPAHGLTLVGVYYDM